MTSCPWTATCLEGWTEERARLLKLAFNVTREGNFEHGKSVLEARKDLAELAARFGRSEAVRRWRWPAG